jgi:HK97 family phage portal protein
MNWKFWKTTETPDILAASPENQSTNLSNPSSWLADLFGGPTDSGVSVTSESAMRTSAVYSCVTLIAKTIGSLPLKVYRRKANGEAIEVPDTLPYYLLHDEPNPAMTSCVWREYLTASILLGGNAYIAIGRNHANQVIDLFPIPSGAVSVERVNGENRYTVRVGGSSTEIIHQSDMLHIPGLGFDGVQGLSVITYAARQAVGLSLATEQHGAKLFYNGARLGVVLKHPKSLSKDAQTRLRHQFQQQQGGLSNAFKTMVLEEGIDVTNISMTSEDAQFLETRRFQVEDVARFFGVPPHMIGHTDKQTSWGTGVEQTTLGFLIFTIIPWLTRFEQEFNRKLFPRSPFYAQFKHQGLMRGDSTARSAYYASGHQNGWLTTNEIRKAEDLPSVAGGDQLFIQTNLAPITRIGVADPAMQPGKTKNELDDIEAMDRQWDAIAPKLTWSDRC